MLKEKLAALEFLQAKTPPLVGCDISSSSVKMVEISEAIRQQVGLADAVEGDPEANGKVDPDDVPITLD